jgi:hypothetical protein
VLRRGPDCDAGGVTALERTAVTPLGSSLVPPFHNRGHRFAQPPANGWNPFGISKNQDLGWSSVGYKTWMREPGTCDDWHDEREVFDEDQF